MAQLCHSLILGFISAFRKHSYTPETKQYPRGGFKKVKVTTDNVQQ